MCRPGEKAGLGHLLDMIGLLLCEDGLELMRIVVDARGIPHVVNAIADVPVLEQFPEFSTVIRVQTEANNILHLGRIEVAMGDYERFARLLVAICFTLNLFHNLFCCSPRVCFFQVLHLSPPRLGLTVLKDLSQSFKLLTDNNSIKWPKSQEVWRKRNKFTKSKTENYLKR